MRKLTISELVRHSLDYFTYKYQWQAGDFRPLAVWVHALTRHAHPPTA